MARRGRFAAVIGVVAVLLAGCGGGVYIGHAYVSPDPPVVGQEALFCALIDWHNIESGHWRITMYAPTGQQGTAEGSFENKACARFTPPAPGPHRIDVWAEGVVAPGFANEGSVVNDAKSFTIEAVAAGTGGSRAAPTGAGPGAHAGSDGSPKPVILGLTIG